MDNRDHTSRHTIAHLLTRDFVLGVLALFGFMTGFYALLPTLPVYLQRQGSNPGEIGIIVGAYSASALASRLFIGKLLRRHSERSVMMAGALLFGLTFFALLVFRSFWPLLATRLFQGIAFACVDTAALAFIVNAIPSAYRGQGIGYFLLAPTLALAVAPSSGMFLVNRYSFPVLLVVCTVLALCSFLFAYMLKGKDKSDRGRGEEADHDRLLDWRIVPPAVTSLLQNFIWGAIGAFFPLYAIQCGVSNPGLFFTATAVMLVAGRTIGGKFLDTYSKERIIPVFIGTAMVAMVTLSFSTVLPMFVVAGLIWGTASSFFYPATMAYAFEYAGSSGGAAIGTIRAIMDMGLALGPVVMGLLVPFTGYRMMFLCLAFVCLVNLTYFHFYVRRHRRARV